MAGGDGQTGLSLCMIVRDEERWLGRCLEGALPICDELVVVDTGSADRTVEIARSYGSTLGHFAWRDDFAAARNASLAPATRPWVLVLDADEWLDEPGRAAIRAFLASDPPPAVHTLRQRSYLGATGFAEWGECRPARLFAARPGVRFRGRYDEQLEGLPLGEAPALAAATIHHDGYRPGVKEARGKYGRNLACIERARAEEPDEPLHALHHAQMLNDLGRLPEAEVAARRAVAGYERARLAADPALYWTFEVLARSLLARLLLAHGDAAGARDAAYRSLALEPTPPAYEVYGAASEALGDPDAALVGYRGAVRCPEPDWLPGERATVRRAAEEGLRRVRGTMRGAGR